MHNFKCGKYLTHLGAQFVMGACLLATLNAHAASYNSATGELFLPHIINGSTTLVDVVMQLKPDGTYQINEGTEMQQPFLCLDKFTQATLELVKSATSTTEINSLLACHWNLQITNESYANESRPASSGGGGTWYDSSCSSITVGFFEHLGEITTTVSLQEKNLGCNTTGLLSIANFYNIQTKAFLISRVLINEDVFATEVVLKFGGDNRYELVHYSPSKPAELPVICRTLTIADFDAITVDMKSDEISKKLNCQWNDKRLPQTDPASFSWRDHECNEISITEGVNKQFFEKKTTGCGTFGAH